MRYVVFILFLLPVLVARADEVFNKDVLPMLQKHCFGCHGPKKQKSHDYLYFEFCKSPKQKIFSQAVRVGVWKAYRQAGKPLELYDLAKDPYEKKNLAGSKPDLVAKMKAVIKEAHQPLPTQ
jgi:hypothetical protein